MNIDEITLVSRIATVMVWAPAYTPERLMFMATSTDHHEYAKQLAMETPMTYKQSFQYLVGLREAIELVRAQNATVEEIV